ncbi:uncharacterized protein isoform X2 [Rhodnius prolixus]|uniref:uncharacterized protein isoform X2 n=1 Tax=Rhodnius prolixus TaxID=13249 RepID=UPI003D18F6C6
MGVILRTFWSSLIKASNISSITITGMRHVSCVSSQKKKYMDIECTVALITGGTSGIGFAAAHELLCKKAKYSW